MEQIKIDFIPCLKKRYEKTVAPKYNIMVNGENIGKIEWHYNNHMGKFCWCVYYDRDVTGGYVGYENYSTIIKAKRAIRNDYIKHIREHKSQTQTPVKELPMDDNSEFFPTPSALIGKMIERVNWKEVKMVLEPSAGKGDIVECVKAYCKSAYKYNGQSYARDKLLDIDCIELDPNLRLILSGKKFRVVHDDFLTYYTPKRYDLIIMNPPFSNGDEHLIKAIEMQEQNGGQIVCLLNAETLRNAYTNRRKVLMQMLKKYGAQIDYIKDAFKHAERRTDVTVAVVYINIPRRKTNSEMFERMKKATELRYEQRAEFCEIAPNDKIETLIRSYEIESAATIAFMDEYNALANRILLNNSDYPIIELKIGGHDSYYGYTKIDSSTINDYLQIVRRKYWHKLLSMPELTDKMTSQMRSDFYNKLNEMGEFEFSKYNIEWLFLNINAQIWEGIDDEILKLFEKFTNKHAYYDDCTENIHYYNGWKTNKAHKVNYKIIIPAYGSFAKTWGYNSRQQFVEKYNSFIDARSCYSTLADLEKTLNYLDGNRTAEFDLERALRRAEINGITKNIRCKYFDVTFYKKGTCHIVFRPETYRLIDALNIYAARSYKWLPPSYGQKHYYEMTAEEKSVIDEFQGEQAYESVMADKEGYFITDNKPSLLLLS